MSYKRILWIEKFVEMVNEREVVCVHLQEKTIQVY